MAEKENTENGLKPPEKPDWMSESDWREIKHLRVDMRQTAISAYQEVHERGKNEAVGQKTKPVQMFLPGLEEAMRAMPNHIARSSLFAPVARGRKKLHDETPLVSRADAVITYSGVQLDEAQADVWMHLVYLARNTPLGEPVEINRAAVLKAIGRKTSGYEYKWLHKTLKAFGKATIIVEAKRKDGTNKYHVGHTKLMHMLDFDYNEEAEVYSFTIDPRWKALFDGREYALIDWPKRLQISQGKDLAKALQRLFVTSNESQQRYALDWLKDFAQNTGRLRFFKSDSLPKALLELERLEIVESWTIEESTKGKEQLVVWLTK